MQNMGRGQFTYDVFKAAYDEDPKLQELVTNFDQKRIELKSSESDDLSPTKKTGGDKVAQMAKQATNLGD